MQEYWLPKTARFIDVVLWGQGKMVLMVGLDEDNQVKEGGERQVLGWG